MVSVCYLLKRLVYRVLDSYFIHRYLIIKYRSSSIKGEINQVLCKLWPFFNFIISSVCTKNGFHSISFEKICVLDSYFIHRYIIIKYKPSSLSDKIGQLSWVYGPFSTSFFAKCLFQGEDGSWTGESVSY